jgi:uncharacterized membrane protein
MTYLPPTYPHPSVPADSPSAVDRSFGYLGYILLFLSVFFAGVTAFMALILAYARRDGAGPLMRSHWVFQIRIFWIAFALTLAGGAMGFSAMVDWARHAPPALEGEPSPDGQGQAPGMLIPVADRLPPAPESPTPAALHAWSYRFQSGPVRLGRSAAIKGMAALGLLIAATLWSLIASVFGAVRLASGRPIGHSRT